MKIIACRVFSLEYAKSLNLFFFIFFKITERELCHDKPLQVTLFTASVVRPNDKIIESTNDLLKYSREKKINPCNTFSRPATSILFNSCRDHTSADLYPCI